MCTLTHFAHPLAPATGEHSTLHSVLLSFHQPPFEEPHQPRFQVILAGKAFFHIKEISTGCVRGFRASHNEACALARFLESH
ncbi:MULTISPECIES: hypothetical protein [unclassified Pseudomonas]|jgi:hypothetical protein|uniref:hypothetical protein n=1 Tax=unclassified Pseudomonas TaxID=196821 RepID=UPI0009E7B49C|nr:MULTISPECIES: hypothetical protein [unclassified Pseudomonas]WPN45302.1 hypothetical protein QMK58_19265 [Pseudomonas sp. P8_241]